MSKCTREEWFAMLKRIDSEETREELRRIWEEGEKYDLFMERMLRKTPVLRAELEALEEK